MEQLLLDFESLPATAIPLMNPDELFGNCSREILSRAQETGLWERKSARVHREDLSTYFSMWANTPPHGGLVAVGIENDGKITGCLSQDQQKINNLEKAGRELCSDARYDIKRINVVNDRGEEDYVIVIRVYYRPDKVVELASGRGYIRRGDSRYTLSEEEKRELAIDKGQVS
ncbi:MAG: ATP-binding protein, partial [Planctomycetota bacterium]